MDWTKIKERVESGKLLLIRTPPWKCMYCREKTIDTFKWEANGNIKATCSKCGKWIGA